MQEYAGRAAIGHVRYATCGADDRSYAQPFERHHLQKCKWFALRLQRPARQLSSSCATSCSAEADYHLARETDTEIIMHYISRELSGDRRPRAGRGVPQRQPAVRRGL